MIGPLALKLRHINFIKKPKQNKKNLADPELLNCFEKTKKTRIQGL